MSNARIGVEKPDFTVGYPPTPFYRSALEGSSIFYFFHNFTASVTQKAIPAERAKAAIGVGYRP